MTIDDVLLVLCVTVVVPQDQLSQGQLGGHTDKRLASDIYASQTNAVGAGRFRQRQENPFLNVMVNSL